MINGGVLGPRWAFAVAAAVAVGALVAPAVPAAAVSTVTVDGARQFQTITGLGVNVNAHAWEGGALRPGLDLLVDQMGARVARVIIEKADWEATNDNANPLVFNDAYYNSLYSTTKFTDLWSTISYLNGKGVTVSLALMGAAPAWMGGSDLTPGAEAEYAEMVASLIRYARQTRGLNVTLLEPFNELEWDGIEGVRATPEQTVQTLRLLGQRLDATGFTDVRFVTPNPANLSVGVTSYLTPLLADPYVSGKIAHLGLHNYSGSTDGVASTIASSARPATDFWMTEFSAWCNGCDFGAPNPGDWPFAQLTGQYLLQHLSDGAAGATVWDGVDSFYEHHASVTFWGMLSGGGGRGAYQPRKTFYTMAQVMRYVPTGSRVLDVTSDDPQVNLTAFRDPASGRLTVAGFNLADTPKTVTVRLNNLPGYQSLDVVQTNATSNLAAAGTATVVNGQLSVTVPADTMVTLTGVSTAGRVYVLPSEDVSPLMAAIAASVPTLAIPEISTSAGTFSMPGCATTTSPLPATDADLAALLSGSTYTDIRGRIAGPLVPGCTPDAVTVADRR